MKLFILIILISHGLLAQQNKIEKTISKLNNTNAFTIDFTGYKETAKIFFSNESLELINSKKYSNYEIIFNIKESNAIALHLILSKINQPKTLNYVDFQGIYDIEDIDYGEIAMMKFTINKMVFIQDIINKKYIISTKSVEKLKAFWKFQLSTNPPQLAPE